MSDNPLALLQQQATQLPSSVLQAMGLQSQDEMQSNVGPTFAVVTIKGKVWGIKHGGQSTPITMNINGQLYAQPYFDVVIPLAKAELSKTFYPSGYSDGDDSAPTCWSEDGITPLAPAAQRPIDPNTGGPCNDCRMCPMNAFGSKVSDNGSNGKACADTRKMVVLPMVNTGLKDVNGHDTQVLDAENIRYGGPMLLRAPAASLKPVAEYSQKLQAMGVPYYAVVTRMEFDQTVAYPKFKFSALRYLSEAEAQQVVAIRNGPAAKQLLSSGHVASAPAALEAPQGTMAPVMAAQQAAVPVVPAAPTTAAPVVPQAAPVVQPPIQQAPPPQYAPPVQQAAPPPPVPVQAPPAPVVAQWPPQGWTAHPDSPGWFYSGQDVLTEADLRARYATPQAPAVGAAAVVQPQVTAGLMNTVDQLLGS